jgi:hypothetical protein
MKPALRRYGKHADRHQVEPDAAEMAARYGADTSVLVASLSR